MVVLVAEGDAPGPAELTAWEQVPKGLTIVRQVEELTTRASAMGDDDRDPPKMMTDGWGVEVTVIDTTSHGFGGGAASRNPRAHRHPPNRPGPPASTGGPCSSPTRSPPPSGWGTRPNTGSGGAPGCFATDASGKVIAGHVVELAPGRSSGWCHGPPGATAVFVANIDVDDGHWDAELTHDTPMYWRAGLRDPPSNARLTGRLTHEGPMTPRSIPLPVTLRIRGAAVGPPAARDLMGTLQATGWAATSLRQPHGGQPEVDVVIGSDTPGLRGLLGTLPGLLVEWRDRNRLSGFEMVVHRHGGDAVHIPVVAGDGPMRDLLADLTATA